MHKELLKPKEIAELAGVGTMTVHRWINAGLLKTVNMNAGLLNRQGLPMRATHRILYSDFLSFIKRQKNATEKETPCQKK